MHGPDVAEVQRVLGVADDGEFGPDTARAVAGWKRARGARSASGELDPLERRRLLGDVLLRAVRLMEHWATARIGEEPVGSNRVPELVSLALIGASVLLVMRPAEEAARPVPQPGAGRLGLDPERLG